MKSSLIILFLTIFVKSSLQQETIPCEFDIAVLPHPVASLCNKYVLCVFGVGEFRDCPAGQVFFPTVGVMPPFGECEPGYVDTCSRLTTLPPTTTTTTPIPPSTTQGISIPSSTTQGISTPSPPGIPSDICQGLLFTRIKYPFNCYQYIFCIFERPHLGECGSRQIFLENAGICFRGNRETCQTCLFC